MRDSRRDGLDRETRRCIMEHGHQIIGVFPTEPGDPPPFAYTVGRTAKGRPELLITGPLPTLVAGTLLNDAAALDDETPLEPGDVEGLLAGGYLMHAVEADPVAGEMFQAISFYDEADVTALQLVWPDGDGAFPWDDGYMYPADLQPVHRKGAS